MSDKPIQVGDLAMIVRPTRCSCHQQALGRIIKVVAIEGGVSQLWRCSVCGMSYKKLPGEGQYAIDEDGKHRGLYRLKRIPPLSELEGQRTKEDMKEPA